MCFLFYRQWWMCFGQWWLHSQLYKHKWQLQLFVREWLQSWSRQAQLRGFVNVVLFILFWLSTSRSASWCEFGCWRNLKFHWDNVYFWTPCDILQLGLSFIWAPFYHPLYRGAKSACHSLVGLFKFAFTIMRTTWFRLTREKHPASACSTAAAMLTRIYLS